MDASRNPDSIAPYVQMSRHLCRLGFSAPTVLVSDAATGYALLEDFGDDTFTRLLGNGREPEPLFALATDVLIALHHHPNPTPEGLRAYDPDAMLADLDVFLEWCTAGLSTVGCEAFRAAWREALVQAHRVPSSLLLRDYHAANLMLLHGREGIRQVGLLDFQDAYRGPVTYDLISLLEDARLDLPAGLRDKMLDRYLGAFPHVDRQAFDTSAAILAALRHTRVLGIFERLKRRDAKPDYQRLYASRVRRLLHRALGHPSLAEVRRWFLAYGRQD
jgi:N-acetylmuramate 1-kinase